MTRESELKKSLINILHLSFSEIDFDALLRKEQIIVSRGTLKMKKFSNLKFLDILFLDSIILDFFEVKFRTNFELLSKRLYLGQQEKTDVFLAKF